MRISRKTYLSQTGGIVHKFWRAHNRSYLLQMNTDKENYLKDSFYTTEHKSVNSEVKIMAFCVMSNHSHQLVSYEASSDTLSRFMRIAHARFGQKYNKKYQRQGAVAYDRPKTPQVQPDDYHQMLVQFYIEANALRAGLTKNLKLYAYSSYRYYAWGIKDKYTEKLSQPEWYKKLGATAKQRQSKYRSLFDKYIRDLLQKDVRYTKEKFIGDPFWKIKQEEEYKKKKDPNLLKPPDKTI